MYRTYVVSSLLASKSVNASIMFQETGSDGPAVSRWTRFGPRKCINKMNSNISLDMTAVGTSLHHIPEEVIKSIVFYRS